jgi:phage shock protein C
MIAGVCGGIAKYLDVDPTVVRLACVMLAIVPGAIVLGVIAYIAAWLLMPSGTAPEMQSAPSTA